MSALSNKVAIVTGASSGIGAAIAVKFVEDGAKVTMVGRNQTKLTNVAQKLEKKGHAPLIIIADVTNESDCRRIISETLNNFGKLDILINNAGVGGAGNQIANVMDKFDEVMTTNFRSAVFMTHLAASHLMATKGNIINMSSAGAHTIIPGASVAYSCSKAAITHFTRCVALELSSKGIRVNAISPGPVRSDFFENVGIGKATADMIWDSWKQKTALGRIGDAKEIAELASFLASDKARSITGSVFVSDNGFLLKISSS